MTKRFIYKSEMNSEIKTVLVLELIKSGKVKNKRDLCKQVICPLVVCKNNDCIQDLD